MPAFIRSDYGAVSAPPRVSRPMSCSVPYVDWVPESNEGVALLVGFVAFAGTLLGATLAFASNFISTSRQIDRQERDARRSLYGDYLAMSVTLRAHHGDRARSYARLMQLRDDVETKAIDPENPSTLSTWEVTYPDLDKRFVQLREDKERLDQLSNDLHAQLVGAAFKIKIMSPELLYQAAVAILDFLMASGMGPNPKGLERVMHLFHLLARADTGAQGAPAWRKTAHRHAAEVGELLAAAKALDNVAGDASLDAGSFPSPEGGPRSQARK